MKNLLLNWSAATNRQKFNHGTLGNLLTKMLSDSAVYMLGTVLVGIGNFVLISVFTNYLSPAEFGVYALVEIVLLVVISVTPLGLGFAYLKWYADLASDDREYLLYSSLVVVTIISLLSGLGFTLYLLSPLTYEWRLVSGSAVAYLLAPLVAFESINAILLTHLRAERKSRLFAICAVVRVVLWVVSSIWLVQYNDAGLYGVFEGRLWATVLSTLLALVWLLPHIKLGFRWQLVAPMIRYGVPIMVSGLIVMLLDMSGRFFLDSVGTLEDVGYYAIALKLSSIYTMLIVQPFGVAWGALLFQVAKWENSQYIFSKILNYVIAGGLILVGCLTLTTPIIYRLFSAETYWSSASIFPIILLVRSMSLIVYPVTIGVYIQGKTHRLIPIYALGLIISFACSFVIVPVYGVVAVSWIWLLAWGVIVTVIGFSSQQFYPLRYEPKLVVPAAVVTGVTLWFATSERLFGMHWSVPLVLALIIFFVGFFIILGDIVRSNKNSLLV